jgi:hypothetical protein
MKPFENLSFRENEELLKLPALISLLAANGDGMMDEAEKKSAIKISHIKTFSSEPSLTEYYKQADAAFINNIEYMDNILPRDITKRENFIKDEIVRLEKIVQKLGKEAAGDFNQSMAAFTNHVSKAHHNVFIDFILPIPLPGLSV